MSDAPSPRRDYVAVVDDEASARETLEALLLPQPYDIRSFASPGDALEAFRRDAPDVILLDVMMPEMDGFETCRALKASDETRNVPVILVTALSSRDDYDRGLDAGADEFLNKPVSGHLLRARVRSMLRVKHQYDKLAEAMRLREDLAHMVVHDMRSPLTSASIQVELCLRQYDEDPQLSQAFQGLQRSISKLQNFMNDLLAMAKFEAGTFVAHREQIDPVQILDSVLRYHREAAEPKRIRITRTVEVHDQVDADPNLIERSLDNLLGNAVKYSQPDSEISVKLTTTSDARQGRSFRVSVSDSGPGIPDASKRKVFNRYEVAAAKRRGTAQVGLGLAFVRLAAESHGGTCWVEDNDPSGSVFQMRIPYGR